MCCEPSDVFKEVERGARTMHKCCECNQAINSGDRYLYISMLYEGSWSHEHMCLACRATHTAVMKINDCGCFCVGGLQEELRDFIFEVAPDEMPPEVVAFGERTKAGWLDHLREPA